MSFRKKSHICKIDIAVCQCEYLHIDEQVCKSANHYCFVNDILKVNFSNGYLLFLTRCLSSICLRVLRYSYKVTLYVMSTHCLRFNCCDILQRRSFISLVSTQNLIQLKMHSNKPLRYRFFSFHRKNK